MTGLIAGLIFTATFLFVGHAPMAAGDNGPNCYRNPWQSCFIQTGEAACAYPTGTLLYMPAWVTDFGLPTVIRCNGGGGPLIQAGGVIDLAFVSEDYPAERDVAMANAWGRRSLTVRVELAAPGTPAILAPATIPRRQDAHKATWRRRHDLQ